MAQASEVGSVTQLKIAVHLPHSKTAECERRLGGNGQRQISNQLCRFLR